MLGVKKSMNKKHDYIIIGGGLCGLVLAKVLSKRNKAVLILEKGRHVDTKRLGSIFYTPFLYDKWALLKSRQGVTIYRFIAVGGTSIVSCGNAIKFSKVMLSIILLT